MIPLRDHEKTKTIPFMTYLILVVNVLVFFFMQGLFRPELKLFVANFALLPRALTQGEMFYTLVTSLFLHGGIGHIFSNMLFFYIFGDNLEDAFGHFGFLIFYLVCGVLASLSHVFINWGSTVPLLGASGAIAGLMGGYLVLFPRNKIDVLFIFGFIIRIFTIPAVTVLLYWIVFQFLIGLGSLGISGAGGVAYFAHVGGFVSGVVLTLILKPILKSGN